VPDHYDLPRNRSRRQPLEPPTDCREPSRLFFHETSDGSPAAPISADEWTASLQDIRKEDCCRVFRKFRSCLF
jgi:hypothetical protein